MDQKFHFSFFFISLHVITFIKQICVRGKGGFVYALKPTPELYAVCQRRRTQVLYTMDISMVLLKLELTPGKVVVEAGFLYCLSSHRFISLLTSNLLHHFSQQIFYILFNLLISFTICFCISLLHISLSISLHTRLPFFFFLSFTIFSIFIFSLSLHN